MKGRLCANAFGLDLSVNRWQGSFVVEYLTDMVEEDVYKEFEAISARGGVLGAMDLMSTPTFGRGKIQEESMVYSVFDKSRKKHDGSLPLVRVNTFLPKEYAGEIASEIELIRSTEGEKGQQIANVARWQKKVRNAMAPSGETSHTHMADSDEVVEVEVHDGHGLGYLQQTARDRKNVFEALMEAVKTHSPGHICHAFYDVGGEYRRNM